MANPFPPHYLRPEAAAAHVGVSRRQLEIWISEGKIRPPYKPSPQIALFERIRLEADVDALCGHVSDQTQGKTSWERL
jgi:predicted site-specific integrase-resolvase